LTRQVKPVPVRGQAACCQAAACVLKKSAKACVACAESIGATQLGTVALFNIGVSGVPSMPFTLQLSQQASDVLYPLLTGITDGSSGIAGVTFGLANTLSITTAVPEGAVDLRLAAGRPVRDRPRGTPPQRVERGRRCMMKRSASVMPTRPCGWRGWPRPLGRRVIQELPGARQ